MCVSPGRDTDTLEPSLHAAPVVDQELPLPHCLPGKPHCTFNGLLHILIYLSSSLSFLLLGPHRLLLLLFPFPASSSPVFVPPLRIHALVALAAAAEDKSLPDDCQHVTYQPLLEDLPLATVQVEVLCPANDAFEEKRGLVLT